MIVRDEQDVIARCLKNAAVLADEIIVVDTGSVDDTRKICENLGARVFDFVWCDDFSKARNFAFDQAAMDYVMWLDADDVLPDSTLKKLLKVKADPHFSANTVMLPYHVAFDDQGRTTFSYLRSRILKRSLNPRFKGAVHEAITPVSPIMTIDAPVLHKKEHANPPKRNLKIIEGLLAKGESLEPRMRYYYARELMFDERPYKAIAEFERFTSESGVWIEDMLDAHRCLAACKRAVGDIKGALSALTAALALSAPRAEICCDIGDLFVEKEEYLTAAFWYEAALICPKHQNMGFTQPQYYGFIPLLQLCICYDRMGLYDKAEGFNEAAAALNPESAAIEYNRKYFAALKNR